jgi:hypothetical protein
MITKLMENNNSEQYTNEINKFLYDFCNQNHINTNPMEF